jgi:hypothetical protein
MSEGFRNAFLYLRLQFLLGHHAVNSAVAAYALTSTEVSFLTQIKTNINQTKIFTGLN